MTGPCAFHIEVGGIWTVNMPHDLEQIPVRRFNQQMIMVVHKTEYVNNGIIILKSVKNVDLIPVVFFLNYRILRNYCMCQMDISVIFKCQYC
jgi:hypothetical protein